MHYRYPNAVKNQCAIAMRNPKVMKNRPDVIIQMGSGSMCSGWSKHTLLLCS